MEPCKYCGKDNNSYKRVCKDCKDFFYILRGHKASFIFDRILTISNHLEEYAKNIENKAKVLNEPAE
jgi:hypothetical protein